jgi:hypothetical protein
VNGRHNRTAGFNADLEKYLEAGLLRCRVYRLGPDQITLENVARLERQMRGWSEQIPTESTSRPDVQLIDSESTNGKRAVKKAEL